MNIKNILLSCVIVFGSISLSGCYTQLAMFHPEPENDDSEEFQSYSVARVRPNLSLYANDGAGQSLGMAYQTMYNRFSGFMGFGNRYNYYNPYYYGGYYNDYIPIHNIFVYDPKSRTYEIWIPGIQEKKQRIWTRDNKSTTTNLTTTRTNHGTSQSSNSGYSNSSNVSSTRSSSGSSSSSSTSSNSGTRVTKRN